MKYVSVDIETTGLDPDKDDIVEFGAVIDDLERPRPVDTLPSFHAYVLPHRIDEQYRHLNEAAQQQHARYHGDPYALSMHPAIFRRIAKREAGYNYYAPTELVVAFKAWMLENGLGKDIFGNGDPINFCGKNFASFDLNFLKKIPNWYLLDRSHRSFDPTPLFIKVGQDKVPPGTAQCLRRAGLTADVAHTAIEDAIAVIKLVRFGLLVNEPADYSEVADEKPKLRDYQQEVVDKVLAGTASVKLPPKLPERVSGCSVTVGVAGGKLQPIVKKAQYVVRNSPLAKK